MPRWSLKVKMSTHFSPIPTKNIYLIIFIINTPVGVKITMEVIYHGTQQLRATCIYLCKEIFQKETLFYFSSRKRNLK